MTEFSTRRENGPFCRRPRRTKRTIRWHCPEVHMYRRYEPDMLFKGLSIADASHTKRSCHRPHLQGWIPLFSKKRQRSDLQ